MLEENRNSKFESVEIRHPITGEVWRFKGGDYSKLNLRDYSKNKHKQVDDTPYGGGAGMVLMPQPIFDAVEALKSLETLASSSFDMKKNIIDLNYKSLVNVKRKEADNWFWGDSKIGYKIWLPSTKL